MRQFVDFQIQAADCVDDLIAILCGAIYQVRFAQGCGKDHLKRCQQWKFGILLTCFYAGMV
jgi:hypothetical protein